MYFILVDDDLILPDTRIKAGKIQIVIIQHKLIGRSFLPAIHLADGIGTISNGRKCKVNCIVKIA